MIQLSVDEVENCLVIRSRVDRGETRLMKCLRRIISLVDESVIVGQRTILADVTFRLNVPLMPRGNAMEIDLRHRFERA